ESPGRPAATGPSAWIDGRAPAFVSIGPPSAVPFSGIAGYAVSVSGRAGEAPCARPTRCAEAELAVPGGLTEHQFQLGRLPEGVNSLNVAAVSGSGVASAPTSVPIRVDASAPTIRITGPGTGWVNHPVTVTAIAADPFAGVAAAGPNGPFTALTVDG